MKFHTIFCDMDGVIADFDLEAVRAHLRTHNLPHLHVGQPLDLTSEMLYKRWAKGKSLQKNLANGQKMEREAFWEPIDLDPLFWRKILPYHHSADLLKMLAKYCDHLTILTTPHTHPSCYQGKRQWLIDHGLGDLELIFCSYKWRLARSNCLLIDDHDKHVMGWQEQLQHAILFPAMTNDEWSYATNPVPRVQQQILEILESTTNG